MATAVLPPGSAVGHSQLSSSSAPPPDDDDGDAEQLLRCCVCHERLREPLLLDCLHDCCRQCTPLIDASNAGSHAAERAAEGDNGAQSSSRSISKTGVCPACYEPVNVSRSRPDVFIASRLLAAISNKKQLAATVVCTLCSEDSGMVAPVAPHWCDSCNTALCDGCLMWHNRFHKRHLVISAADHCEQQQRQQRTASVAATATSSSGSSASECRTVTCELHGEKLGFFCFSCQLLRCNACSKTCLESRHDITALKGSRTDKYADQQRALLRDAVASAAEQLATLSSRRSSTATCGHGSARARLEPERRLNVERLQLNKAAVLDATQRAYETAEAQLLALYDRLEAEIDEHELREAESLGATLSRSLLYGRALLDADNDDKAGLLNQSEVLLARVRALTSCAAAANDRASQHPADRSVLVEAQLPDDAEDVIGRWIGVCRSTAVSRVQTGSDSGCGTGAVARSSDGALVPPADSEAKPQASGGSNGLDVSNLADHGSRGSTATGGRPRDVVVSGDTDSFPSCLGDGGATELRSTVSAVAGATPAAPEKVGVGERRRSSDSAHPAEARAPPQVTTDRTSVDGSGDERIGYGCDVRNTSSGRANIEPVNSRARRSDQPVGPAASPSGPTVGSVRASRPSESDMPTPQQSAVKADSSQLQQQRALDERTFDAMLNTSDDEGTNDLAAAAANIEPENSRAQRSDRPVGPAASPSGPTVGSVRVSRQSDADMPMPQQQSAATADSSQRRRQRTLDERTFDVALSISDNLGTADLAAAAAAAAEVGTSSTEAGTPEPTSSAGETAGQLPPTAPITAAAATPATVTGSTDHEPEPPPLGNPDRSEEQQQQDLSSAADESHDYSSMPALERQTDAHSDDPGADLDAVDHSAAAAAPSTTPLSAENDAFKECTTFDNLIADDSGHSLSDGLSNSAHASSQNQQADFRGGETSKAGGARPTKRPASTADDVELSPDGAEMHNDIAAFDTEGPEDSRVKNGEPKNGAATSGRLAAAVSPAAAVDSSAANHGNRQAIRFGRAQMGFKLTCDCVDVAFTADGGVLLAAGERGFLELEAKSGKLLSGWLPPYDLAPLRDPWVGSVQLLEDGRVVVGMPTSPMLVVLRRHDVLPDEWVHDQSIMLRSHCVWRLATRGSLIAAAVCSVSKSLPVGGSPGNELLVVSSVGGIEQRLKLLYPIWSLVMTPLAVVTLSQSKQPMGAALSGGTGPGEDMQVVDAYSSGGQLLWRHGSVELVAGLCLSASGRLLYLSLPESRRVMALDADSGHPVCDVLRTDSHDSFSTAPPAWIALREEPVDAGSSGGRRRKAARGALAVLASDRRGLVLFPISS